MQGGFGGGGGVERERNSKENEIIWDNPIRNPPHSNWIGGA